MLDFPQQSFIEICCYGFLISLTMEYLEMEVIQTTAVAVAPEIAASVSTEGTAAAAPVTPTEPVVAKTVSSEDARVARLNEELRMHILISYAGDEKNRDSRIWTAHAADFVTRVEEIGGYANVLPHVLQSFMRYCGNWDVKRTLLESISRAFGEIIGDKERLVVEDARVVSLITLTSMAAPEQTLKVCENVKAAYAAHDLEIPVAVSAKIAEREKKSAEYAEKRAETEMERKVHAFRHPRIFKGMGLEAATKVMVTSGYSLKDRRGNNLFFVGRDPETNVVTKKTYYGDGNTPATRDRQPQRNRGSDMLSHFDSAKPKADLRIRADGKVVVVRQSKHGVANPQRAALTK